MTDSLLEVECIYAGPGVLERRVVRGAGPMTVGAAAAASGLAEWLAERELPVAGYAVFGRKVEAGDAVADGDRLELLRPLLVTPMQARRRRAAAKARS